MSAVSVGQRFGAWVVALVGPDRQNQRARDSSPKKAASKRVAPAKSRHRMSCPMGIR
jgi:hypothetical protein